MSAKHDTNKKAMLKALMKSRCNVSKACKAVGISRNTHYDYIKNDEEYSKGVDSVMESVVDMIEEKLQEVGLDGNVVALNSFLNARAKNRGYGNNQIIKEIHTKKTLPVSNSVKRLDNVSDA